VPRSGVRTRGVDSLAPVGSASQRNPELARCVSELEIEYQGETRGRLQPRYCTELLAQLVRRRVRIEVAGESIPRS